jgi:predicted TIM-barrel fold metal-dependent hydrolase
MRRLFESGDFQVLGEVESQYGGIAPDDERMRAFWALAEELDIPVGIPMGEGPPGVIGLLPKYRARLSSPYLLEDVLVRHPRLRVYVMHYGSPLIDEMIAMLATYPSLYVDIGGTQFLYHRPYFYEQLRQFIDAGFGTRVMFGSDPVQWPGLIETSIAIVEEAPFLSEEQKRDIFYNNAARFLRLSEEEVARHHGR